MTVASTTSPKSIAPTDSRLADSPRTSSKPMANARAKGIVAATINALREVAEEQPLHDEDQDDALDHVVQHGVRW